MPFTIFCTNKKCGKFQEPYLDNDKVYCSLCNEEIINVTSFAKNQMRMSKQFRKKSDKSFSIRCNRCNAFDRPKLINGKVVCIICNKEITNISNSYIIMLREMLNKADSDA